MPSHELTGAVLTALHDIFARFPGLTFSLAHAGRFPNVLYLAPTPDEPFQELTRAVVKRFPETPPYRGAFADIIPHLTVAEVPDHSQLDAIAAEFSRVTPGWLPLHVNATEVALMEIESGRWQIRAKFRLDQA